MRKALFLLTLLYSYSFALDIYGFNMGERYITLNDGEIRRFDGDALQFFSSYFGKQFIYQGPENSTFIVADNRLVTDKSYNMRAYIIVDSGRLVMNLNSNGVFALDNSYLHGVYFNFSNNHTSNYASFTGPLILANPGSTIDITTINTFFIGRGNLILDNSTINITNVKRLINQTLADHGASIINHSGTLYIGADVYNYYYIDQEFYYMGKAYTRETHGGHFYQSAGTSTIKGSFYNGGTENIIIKDGPYPGGEFDPTAPQERLDALVEIENGGKFTVNGNFENGKNDPSIGCIDEDNCDYYGIGYLVAKGGSEIIVGGDFKSDTQGDSFVSNGFYYRSSVDLQDSTLKVGGSFSAYRSNISLTGNSSIHANSFFLDKTASLNFIGSDTGFSFINATTSATFNGSVSFQLTGSLLKNDDMSYLILDTPLLQGSTLREGKVTVLDSTGQTLTNYITEIVKKDDQYLLAFCDVNTGCSSDEGGDTGDGEQGGSGNEGTGGDNQGGGNSGSYDKPITPNTNTPPSSDPIYNAIYEALDGSIINNNNLISAAASTVEKQIETMQDERKTYQGSLIYHNMLGRIAHLSSRNNNIAFNRNTNNYALSKSNSRIETEGMYLDGFNYAFGFYSRLNMPYSLELDVLGYYANNHNKYDRIFAGLSLHQGDYKRHNIGAQARLGYRFEFKNEHSLKPYLGILSSSYYMPEYKENGILPITRTKNSFTSLYGVLGIEYRKVLDSGSFFISLEGVKGKAVFGDKNYEMSIGQEKISYENEKELFANVFAGASFSMSKDFDISA